MTEVNDFITPSHILLATLGTHKRKRPLSPLKAAREIQRFLEDGGRPEQLPIKTDAIREFLSLLNLSDIVQKMLGWSGINRGEIGMYSGSRISTLERVEDQEILARAVLERKLSSNEVRRIVRHKNRLRGKSMKDCIETVVATRPIKRNLFITQLSDEVLRRLEQEAEIRRLSTTNLLQEILSDELPSGSLISMTLNEDFVMLLLEKEGNEVLLREAKESGVSLKEAVDVIVSKRL